MVQEEGGKQGTRFGGGAARAVGTLAEGKGGKRRTTKHNRGGRFQIDDPLDRGDGQPAKRGGKHKVEKCSGRLVDDCETGGGHRGGKAVPQVGASAESLPLGSKEPGIDARDPGKESSGGLKVVSGRVEKIQKAPVQVDLGPRKGRTKTEW